MLKFILAYLAIGLLTSVIYIVFASIYSTIGAIKNYFVKDEDFKKDLDKLNLFEKTLIKIIFTIACFFVCIFETFKYPDCILFKNILMWPYLVFVMFNKDYLEKYLEENKGL